MLFFWFWIQLHFLKQIKYRMEMVTVHFCPHVHTQHVMAHHEIKELARSWQQVSSALKHPHTHTHTHTLVTLSPSDNVMHFL